MSYRVTLILNNLNFCLRLNDTRLQPLIEFVTNKLVTYSLQYNKFARRLIRTVDRAYYSYDTKKNLYRFPIKVINNVMKAMGQYGITKEDIELINNCNIDTDIITFNLNKKYTPRDYQEDYTNAVMDNLNKKIFLIDAPTGAGKAQPYDSLVRVSDGWKKIGELKVGDKVITPDGGETEVLSLHPQPAQMIYKLTFYDGRSCECTGEHLFNIHNPHMHNKPISIENDGYWTTMSVNELIKRGIGSEYKPTNRFYIPLIKHEIKEDKKYIIHPYILGCILGDGSITIGCVSLTLSSPYVINKINSLLPDTMEVNKWYDKHKNGKCYNISLIMKDKGKNIFKEELEKLKLWGCNAYTKFIPKEYLNGSEKQKWELLQGLMDTDGYISKQHKNNGSISYSTLSLKLKDDIIDLVRSLGGIVRWNVKVPTYTYKGKKLIGKHNYVLSIRFKHPIMCCTKPSKLERLKNSNQYTKNFKLLLRKIEKVGIKKAICIKLKDPKGLYITNDYIVTHNTMITSMIISRLKMRVGAILLPKFINKWILDAKEYLGVEDDDIYVVQGSESLINLMLEENIDYKIIIFSITTLTYYLSDYETDKNEYPVTPDRLFEHLKIGVMFNDETHLCFGAISKCMTYFNPLYFIGSTATLDSNQRDIKRMYEIVIPLENRISNLVKTEPYTYVKAVQYKLQFIKSIKYKRKQGYNHILYEQSILKNSVFMENYFLMVEHYFREMYLDKRKDKENDKIAIFFSSIDMCTTFTHWLKNRYPTENIYRYIGGDSYHTMLQSNIIISNNGMLGTAVDIPNLISVIQTISTSSLQINLQNFGRLRKLKDREVWYCYLFSREIPRQYHMHLERYNTIRNKIKEYYFEIYKDEMKTI